MRLPVPPLLVVTDRRQAKSALVDIVAAALAGGCRWISMREKDLPASEQIALARSLLPLTKPANAVLTLHGDADLAATAGVDGVHLAAGGNVAEARKRLGADRLVGLSVHHSGKFPAIAAARPDYVIAGPVFETASKPGYGPALGAAGLAAIVAASRAPVIGIGGIDAGSLPHVLATGATGAAVMGGVMRADDPRSEVKSLVGAMQGAQPRPR